MESAHIAMHRIVRWTLMLGSAIIITSCKSTFPTGPPTSPSSSMTLSGIIPLPVSVVPTNSSFFIRTNTAIYVDPGSPDMLAIGQYLAGKLKPATGYTLNVASYPGVHTFGNIYLSASGGDPSLGSEGYALSITTDFASLTAQTPEGVFRGVQTIRQLLPAAVESTSVRPGPWGMATGSIRDYPRFAWRGFMLDVARHFFSVSDVEYMIDLAAYYKINRFHLHLSDDQGWRIAITSWPNLATHGGSTEVGGAAGGYFTQSDYAAIIAYAQARYITVIPEIDMPGHTNAALSSYAFLNCSGIAPPLYTGINVGFSALCVARDTIYSFIDDVVGEIAALTPGPYMHIGGDEASAIGTGPYIHFVDSTQTIVDAHGKQMIGWEEIAQGALSTTSIAQHWASNLALNAVQQGARVIMSPARRTYLDMKYTPASVLGQNWAGYIEVMDGYTWDPATEVTGVSENSILGIEAPLWTETIQTLADIEYMVFPRLAGYAEIGWSSSSGRTWDEYKNRLASHGPRLTAMGVTFYRSPQVPWK